MKRGEIRPGELAGAAPDRADAALAFIGRIRTPFATREDCPRQAAADGPVCRVEVDEPWRAALQGLAAGLRVELLYWMHLARRDLLMQAPRGAPAPLGTFALRSPNRPNPVATSVVTIDEVEPGALLVRGLDCVDGTPLLDIKPARRVRGE
jgi:tRNA-Thr(GGU) m(6)t(6)A37 methyltransferase TsaA